MSGTRLQLVVDDREPVPPYEQLRRQLSAAILDGSLPDGQRLPPIRQVARDLRLATGTVARTYRELEAAGLVVTSRGGGTRVRVPPLPASRRRQREVERREAVQAAATRYLHECRLLGVDEAEAARAVLDLASAPVDGSAQDAGAATSPSGSATAPVR